MKIVSRLITMITVACLCAGTVTVSPVAAMAAENPSEVMLGIFFSSEEDQSDTLYVSFDGKEFRSIGYAYEDSNKWSSSDNAITDSPKFKDSSAPGYHYTWADWIVNCLHDPSLTYRNGVFWSMSGYRNGTYRPMIAYSYNLRQWSYPKTGGGETGVTPSVLPPDRNGNLANVEYDAVAPDLFIDDDGTGWIVVSMGYYATWHGDASTNDKMQPYMIKVTGLAPGSEALDTVHQKEESPKLSYSQAQPINLPVASDDRIDGSIFKANGKYYLTIKENGITNEIWEIDNLNHFADSGAWRLVNGDVVTGFEGPCVTKYLGNYYMYTDKLADWPPHAADGTTGIFVTATNDMSGAWSTNERIRAIDRNGNIIPTRHGSVYTVTDPAAIQTVMNAYYEAGWSYSPSTDRPSGIVTGTRFDDVPSSAGFYNAVEWAVQKGITNGMSERLFGPYETCTRGQVATFLWRAMGEPEPVTTNNPFADVEPKSYCYNAVLWAVEQGITKGTSENTFSPNQTCSSAHIITFMYRAFHPGADGWYEEAGNWARGEGMLEGVNSGVSPAEDCPRANVVTFLYKKLR